ncbi:MAG: anti-sigma factor [Phycisphaerales bacterium]|nr:anti-sigma factor [Phycisphaerales bacterium]
MSNTINHQPHPDLPRLLELLAAESIVDLSADEAAELDALRRRVPPVVDAHGRPVSRAGASAVVGTLLAASAGGSDVQPLSPALRARLIAQGEAIVAGAAVRPAVVPQRLASGRRTWIGPIGWAGWAAAVVSTTFFVWQVMTNQPPQMADRLAEVLEDTTGTVRIALAPQTDPLASGLAGEVIWNRAGQNGFLRVHGLAQNDPAKEQYQVWLVDASRREGDQAVDCGVFNSTGGFVRGDDIYIPIYAKLPVGTPTAFAITVERPGGVVRSTRERLLATAAVPPPASGTNRPGGTDSHWPPR